MIIMIAPWADLRPWGHRARMKPWSRHRSIMIWVKYLPIIPNQVGMVPIWKPLKTLVIFNNSKNNKLQAAVNTGSHRMSNGAPRSSTKNQVSKGTTNLHWTSSPAMVPSATTKDAIVSRKSTKFTISTHRPPTILDSTQKITPKGNRLKNEAILKRQYNFKSQANQRGRQMINRRVKVSEKMKIIIMIITPLYRLLNNTEIAYITR